MEIKDVTELKPIAEKTMKALYGEGIRNMRIRRAEQYPIFGSKEWWYSEVEFEDDEFKYLIRMHIQMADGKVTETKEEQKISKTTF